MDMLYRSILRITARNYRVFAYKTDGIPPCFLLLLKDLALYKTGVTSMRSLISIIMLTFLIPSVYADGVQAKLKNEYLALIKCPAQTVYLYKDTNDPHPVKIYKEESNLKLFKSSLRGSMDVESKEQEYVLNTDPRYPIPTERNELLAKQYRSKVTEDSKISLVDLSSLLIDNNIKYIDIRLNPSSQTTNGEPDISIEVLGIYLFCNCLVIDGL